MARLSLTCALRRRFGSSVCVVPLTLYVELADGVERLDGDRDQIVRRLDADGEPHQRLADAGAARASASIDACVIVAGCAIEALDAAE